MSIIEDGAGTGNKMKVAKNRAHVQAFSTPIFADVSELNEDTYLICTNGFIAISTTDTETGILYIKNTSTTKHLHIASVRACGNVKQKWKVYKNPTAGSLITASTSATITNLVFSNDNTPDMNAYLGSDGSTLTGGKIADNFINNAGHSIEDYEGAMILERNDSMAITVECSAAGDICSRVLAYYQENV